MAVGRGGDEILQFLHQRLPFANLVLRNPALADAHQRNHPLPAVGIVVLVEVEFLGEIVDVEHAALAQHRELADFRGGQPVDVQHADRAVGELQQAGEQILVARMDFLLGLGIEVLDGRADQIFHDVQLVGRQVEHDADVRDAAGEGPDAPRANLEHAAQLAGLQPPLELQDGGVEAFDVADAQPHPGCFRSIDHGLAFRYAERERLLDEGVCARVDRGQRGLAVQPRGHGYRDDVQLLACQHLIVVGVWGGLVGARDGLHRFEIGVGQRGQVNPRHLGIDTGVVPAHRTDADHSYVQHGTKPPVEDYCSARGRSG